MSYLPSLGPDASTLDVWEKYPKIHHSSSLALDEALRNNEEIGPGYCEFVFAYISSLNDCQYCYGSHSEVSKLYGIDHQVMEAALSDLTSPLIEDRLRALLVYANKVTLNHQNLSNEDARAVMDAGWSEDALHHLICICSIAAFMNRFTIATGLDSNEDNARKRGKPLQEWGTRRHSGP